MYKKFFKRVIDTVIALFMLIILFPLLLIIAVAIKLDSKGPIIFRQTRIGLHGKKFSILKFRSMAVGAEHTGSGVYSENGDPGLRKWAYFFGQRALTNCRSFGTLYAATWQ